MYPLAPVRTADPAPLIGLDEARRHLRIDDVNSNQVIAHLIGAAAAHLDGHAGILGRALVTQTWRQDIGCFPGVDIIRLPLRPVQSITHVKYSDDDDAEQTLATSVYGGPYTDALGPFIQRRTGQSWPSTYDRPDAVRVTFVAGYGTAAEVPAAIRQSALLLIAHWFENREATIVRHAVIETPLAVDRLIAPYRCTGF